MQLARGAAPYVLVPAVAAPPAFLVHPVFGVVALALAGATFGFFRDPDRTPPPTGIVSPADGTVSVIREETVAAEEGESDEVDDGDDGGDAETRVRVGVFMNVHDVHVNRAPIGGTVAAVDHVPGANRPAFSKESERNERVHVDFEDHRVTLIAGAFARRITPYLDAGDEVERGDRIGHIAFGSRADVLLPADVDREALAVAEGDSVTAGESVLADAPASDNLLEDATATDT